MNTIDAICSRCGLPIRWSSCTLRLCGYCRLLRDIESLGPKQPAVSNPVKALVATSPPG